MNKRTNVDLGIGSDGPRGVRAEGRSELAGEIPEGAGAGRVYEGTSAESRASAEAELTGHFAAWKVFQAGSREVTEAIIAPEHRGPSPTLSRALARWPGAWYRPDGGGRLILICPVGPGRGHRWLLHVALFIVTAVCALGAGSALQQGLHPPAGIGLFGAVLAGAKFFVMLVHGAWRDILSGWSFAVPLLAILLIHELGHYFAARRYEIDSSLPFFLPVPPSLSPIGSLGAFIRLRSPVLDRRQLLDVGAAGPLAGFVVALAVLVWGYATSEPLAWGPHGTGSFVVISGLPLSLGESFLTLHLRDFFLPGALAVHLSPPAFAGWVGVFVTGLNLLPLSQLDGGHVLYGLVGKRQAVVAVLAIAGLLYLAQYWPVWYAWVVLTLLVGGGRWSHPAVVSPAEPIPLSRRLVGWLAVLVFGMTFVPVPFTG